MTWMVWSTTILRNPRIHRLCFAGQCLIACEIPNTSQGHPSTLMRWCLNLANKKTHSTWSSDIWFISVYIFIMDIYIYIMDIYIYVHYIYIWYIILYIYWRCIEHAWSIWNIPMTSWGRRRRVRRKPCWRDPPWRRLGLGERWPAMRRERYWNDGNMR